MPITYVRGRSQMGEGTCRRSKPVGAGRACGRTPVGCGNVRAAGHLSVRERPCGRTFRPGEPSMTEVPPGGSLTAPTRRGQSGREAVVPRGPGRVALGRKTAVFRLQKKLVLSGRSPKAAVFRLPKKTPVHMLRMIFGRCRSSRRTFRLQLLVAGPWALGLPWIWASVAEVCQL